VSRRGVRSLSLCATSGSGRGRGAFAGAEIAEQPGRTLMQRMQCLQFTEGLREPRAAGRSC
jgi:hypothetical protein